MNIMNRMARAVIRPARAIDAALPIPTISSVNTSGMTVMRKALSHMLPTTSAASTNKALPGPKNRPINMPKIRANNMISAFFNIPVPVRSPSRPSTMTGRRWQEMIVAKLRD